MLLVKYFLIENHYFSFNVTVIFNLSIKKFLIFNYSLFILLQHFSNNIISQSIQLLRVDYKKPNIFKYILID